MKYFVFVLLFAITTILTAEEFPIMMQIKTDLKIPEDFRGGVEEGLTENGYSLVSEETQNQTLKEQATQRKKECYDESCLVDVGKMLAAKGLFLVEVTKKADKYYLFKVKYVDFETGTTQKIKQDYFKYDLNNFEELAKFGKNIIQSMFGKNQTTKEVIKEVIIKDTKQTEVVKDDESTTKNNNSKKEVKNVEKFKIEFITVPSGVEIYDSENNLLGETPFYVSLPKGFTKFSFEKKGFDKIEREIHIKQNERINVSLAEKIYNLKINTNISGAKVFIDGKEKGETPFAIKLKEGIYSIKLEKEEYDSYSEEIPLKKDFEKTITLNKNIFEIIVKSNVEDSKVYIDGSLKGKASYTIKLSKGKHTIKLTKDDFEDKEKEFEINKDETISFELYEKGKGGSGEMVKIPGKNFKMDATEVTVAQFEECVKAGGCSEENFKTNWDSEYNNYGTDQNKTSNKNHPINQVNWYGANEFCKWAGKRLPTEEEWEYAAKGGESYKYAGSDDADEVAWYNKNSLWKTHEVGTKKANGYGLYDMSGNVSEWTNSWWNNKQEYRILRGGDLTHSNNAIQVDYRLIKHPEDYLFHGFRCVQDFK